MRDLVRVRDAQDIAELDGPEGDEIQQQIAWFRREYPTALDRLA